MKESGINTEKYTRTWNIIIAIIVILFIVGVQVFYYWQLHEEREKNLLKIGESNVLETADHLRDYLESSIDAINLSAYTLEDMLSRKQSNKEIQNFIIEQSAAMRNTVSEYSTFFYGYFDGDIITSGSWNPGEDFDATDRPWYIRAIEKDGEIALVEPYVDMNTGKVKMSISKLLRDKKSVIAMDIGLDGIQEIMERASAEDNSAIEFIIDSNGFVVCHSDEAEVGKNYKDDPDGLYAKVMENMPSNDGEYAEFFYDRVDYVFFSANVRDDWRCVYIQDATSAYRTMSRNILITVALSLVVVSVLVWTFRKSNRRSIIAIRLNRQLSSTAEIYRSVYDLDVINDSYSEILTDDRDISHVLGNSQENAQKTMFDLTDALTDKISRDDVSAFVDFSTLDERMSDRKTITIEFLNNEKRWLRGRFIVSQRSADGRVSHVLWLVEDIDKEKQDRDRLIDMSERAIAASEAKSSFLSNMSHEIRTPINAVLGMNEMILRECEDDNILTYSESIRTAGTTLLGLVNDILDFSKIEAGKMEIVPVDYDLSSLLNDLVNMIQVRADEKELTLTLDFDSGTPKNLFGDEIRIKQVITNILTNAVKYTEKGSVTFSVSYERIPDEPDSVLLNFSVKDTGIGIKEEDMKKLFSEFERIEEERNRHIEGTGLGMNITKRLIEMMGSTLQVESVYGQGSRFYFSLKQTVVKWEELGDYEASYREMLANRSSYREKFTAPDAEVLVVDDNPMNLMVFQNLLKRTRVRIDTAAGGREALALALEKKYDIIFLDHMMPDMDGIETLQAMKQQSKSPNLQSPTVCLTANAISGAREQYIEAGFDDYLTKPIAPDKLEEMMIRFIPDEKIRRPESPEDGYGEEVASAESVLPDFVLAIDEIDTGRGIENNAGDAEAYFDMLKVYASTVDRYSNEIEDLYASGDLKNATIKVHALKSTSRIIGAEDLGELAQKLEFAGKEDNTAVWEEELSVLLSRYRAIGEKLAPLVEPEEDDSDMPLLADDILDGFMEQIRTAAAECDDTAIEEVLDELEGFRLPDGKKEIMDKVVQGLDAYDFDAITQALDGK